MIENVEFNDKYRVFKIVLTDGTIMYLSSANAAKLFQNSYVTFDISLTPVVDLAVRLNVITIEEAITINGLVNKGFARDLPNNPLKEQFPQYWDFLIKTRTDEGDPNLI